MQPATKARPVSHPIARRYRLAALLAAVLVVSIACGSGGSSGSTQTDDLDPAPDFTTILYSGGTGEFTLSEQLGHPVLINIWGSWCPPCRAEFPALQQAWDKYKDQGLVLFGVEHVIGDLKSQAQLLAHAPQQLHIFRRGLPRMRASAEAEGEQFEKCAPNHIVRSHARTIGQYPGSTAECARRWLSTHPTAR